MAENYYELRLQINPDMEDLISEIFFENFDCEGIVLAEETYKDLEMVATTEGTLRIFLKNEYGDSFEDLQYDIENILDLSREEFLSRGLSEEELGSWEFTLERKENEDWSKKWKESWDVTHVTDKIAVVPDWIDYTPKEGEVIIKLEPGCAFGTGTHQTTQLCMKALEKYMKPDDTVADIGMGSGILSILAKKLGASFVYGCDNDETVIDVARENARKNGINIYPPLEGGSESLIPGWGQNNAQHKYITDNVVLAKNLRNNPTLPENILWQRLRKSQLENIKFRRQQPIGNYIVDFMAPQEKIIIELDGGQHNSDDGILKDKERDKFLIESGFTVIRIWNTDIYNNLEGVYEYIRKIIQDPTRKAQQYIHNGPHLEIKDFGPPSRGGQCESDKVMFELNSDNKSNIYPPLEGGSEFPIPGWGSTNTKSEFDGVMFELGTADKINHQFDFVCANILHFVLAEIMGDLKNIMKTNALMSLSGILEEKKQMVIDAYEREGLELVEEIHQDQWTSFVVRRID